MYQLEAYKFAIEYKSKSTKKVIKHPYNGVTSINLIEAHKLNNKHNHTSVKNNCLVLPNLETMVDAITNTHKPILVNCYSKRLIKLSWSLAP